MPYVLSKYGPRGPEYVWVEEEKTPQTYEELKEAGYTPLISRYGPEGPEYVYYKTPQPKEEITEYTRTVAPPPAETQESTPTQQGAYRPPDVIVSEKPHRIEQQIIEVYKQAPVVPKYDPSLMAETRTYAQKEPEAAPKLTQQYYYQPTPEQEKKIIELAQQLPPEKRAKYIVESPMEPPKEEPKGIAETLVSIRMEDVQKAIAIGLADIFGLKGERKERFLQRHQQLSSVFQPRLVTGQPMPMFGEPVQAIGSMVTPVESLVYGGERLISTYITHHKPVTPRPPPATTSGIISATLGRPEELELVQQYGPSYVMGSLLGDILLGYATGKILGRPIGWVEGKVWAGAKKIPFVRKATTEIGYQFRQHAPYWLQRAIYGKQLAKAIQIEKQWGWVPTKTGRVGYLEATYGLSFYAQQTLWYNVPTKEWARQVFMESILPRMRIEQQLGWTVGLYPGYGVLPSEAAKPLTLAEKLAQAEKMPVYDLEKTLRMNFIEGQLKPELVTTGVVSTGRKTAFTYRAAFEFEQATKMVMPTRYFVPTYKAAEFMVTRGFPTTPFEVTLARATEEGLFKSLAQGGLAAGLSLTWRETTITPPSPQTFFTAPVERYRAVEFERLFYFAPTKLPIQREISNYLFGLGLSTLMGTLQKQMLKQPSRLKKMLVPTAAPLPTLKEIMGTASAQVVSPTQVATQISLQKQVQRQRQLTNPATPTPTAPSTFTPSWTPTSPSGGGKMRVPAWLMPTKRKRRRRRRRGEPFGLIGRYKRFYPVMPSRKALRELLGL